MCVECIKTEHAHLKHLVIIRLMSRARCFNTVTDTSTATAAAAVAHNMSLIRKPFALNDTLLFKCYTFVIKKTYSSDEFWFKGHDIAAFLEYKKPIDAVAYSVPIEWRRELRTLPGCSLMTIIDSLAHSVAIPSNCQPHTVFVSEPGLYALVTRSTRGGKVYEIDRRLCDLNGVRTNADEFSYIHL